MALHLTKDTVIDISEDSSSGKKKAKKSSTGTKKKKKPSSGVDSAKRRFSAIESIKVKTLARKEYALERMLEELKVLQKVKKGGAHRSHIRKGLCDHSEAAHRGKLVEAYLKRLQTTCESGYEHFKRGKEEGEVHYISFFGPLRDLPSGTVAKLEVYRDIWDFNLSDFLERQIELGLEVKKRTTKALDKEDASEARRCLRMLESAERTQETIQAMLRANDLKELEETEVEVTLFGDKNHLLWQQQMDLHVLVEMLEKKATYIPSFGGQFSAALDTRALAVDYAAMLAERSTAPDEVRTHAKINDKVIGMFYKKMQKAAKRGQTICKVEQLNTQMTKQLGKKSGDFVARKRLETLQGIVESYIRQLDERVANYGAEFVECILGLCKKAWDVELAATKQEWTLELVTKKSGHGAMLKFMERHEGAVSARSKNLTEYYCELFADRGRLVKYFGTQADHANRALKLLYHGLNTECDPRIVKQEYKKEVKKRAREDHARKLADMREGSRAPKQSEDSKEEQSGRSTSEAEIRRMAVREDVLERLQTLYKKKTKQLGGFKTHFARWNVMLAKVDDLQKELEGSLDNETEFRNKLAQWEVSYGKAGLPETRKLGFAISKVLRAQIKTLDFPIAPETASMLQELVKEKVEAARPHMFDRALAFLDEMETNGSVLWPEDSKKKKKRKAPRSGPTAAYFFYFWATLDNVKLSTAERALQMTTIFSETLKPFFDLQLKRTETDYKEIVKQLNACDQTLRYKVQATVIASVSPSKMREMEPLL